MNTAVTRVWQAMATAVVALLVMSGVNTGTRQVEAAPAPSLAALRITSVCVVKWVPVDQAFGVHLKIELSANGNDVYGKLLFEIDQTQKGPWKTAATNITLDNGESMAIDYRSKPVNPEDPFMLWAAVVDADPSTIGPGQGLAATGWFEAARLIPTC